MNRDDIIRLAREAGFVVDEKAQQHQPNCIFHTHHMVDELLKRFAELAVEDVWIRRYALGYLDGKDVGVREGAETEREACVEVCDNLIRHGNVAEVQQRYNQAYEQCKDAIRARGEA
jgi:hypothetical protein